MKNGLLLSVLPRKGACSADSETVAAPAVYLQGFFIGKNRTEICALPLLFSDRTRRERLLEELCFLRPVIFLSIPLKYGMAVPDFFSLPCNMPAAARVLPCVLQ